MGPNWECPHCIKEELRPETYKIEDLDEKVPLSMEYRTSTQALSINKVHLHGWIIFSSSYNFFSFTKIKLSITNFNRSMDEVSTM